MSIHFGMKWWPSLFLREQSPHFIADSSHEEQTIMEERVGEAFAGSEHFTVIGRQLQVGDPAPDFCLDFLDLADLIAAWGALVSAPVNKLYEGCVVDRTEDI